MTPALQGILVIDKPAGWTSHDVVGWVRRWSRERKVGHAGTLDPAATGVLPVAINDGTRVLEFLSGASKAYRAEITFGVETDSADGDGTVIATHEITFSDIDLEHALEAFRGPLTQRPPAHSAVKIGGKRAYALARAGTEVEIPKREVTIFALDPVEWNGKTLTIDIECSKGTYVRSIARDLGLALGCGAYLSNLVRTRSGPFDLCDAWTITELETFDPWEQWPSIAGHPDSALMSWPAILLSESQTEDWRHGRPVPARTATGQPRARVYDNSGNWRGLAEHDQAAGVWRALRVINPQ